MSAALVVGRELQRLARRPRLRVLRVLALACFTGLLALQWRQALRSGLDEPWVVAQIGSFLHGLWAAVALLALAGLAPLLVGGAVAEERDAGTLELLAASGVRFASVLGGLIASRLGWLAWTLLGFAPLMALAGSLGGVTGGAALEPVVQGLGLAALGVPVAAAVGAESRGGLLPALAAWGWTAIASIAALPAVGLVEDDWLFAVSPWAAFEQHPGPLRGLLPVLLALPAAAVVLRRASARVQACVGGDDLLLAPEYLALARADGRAWLALAAWMGTTAVAAVVVAILDLSVGGSLPAAVVAWLWTAALLALGARLTVQTTGAVERWVRGRRAAGPGWQVALAAMDAGRDPPARRPRPLRGNPVAWRERKTKALGAVGAVVRVATVLWFAWVGKVLLGIGAVTPDEHWEIRAVEQQLLLLSVGALVLVVPAAWALCVASMVGERDGSGLRLLALSDLGGAGVVRGKLAAIAWRLAPVWVGAWAVLLAATTAGVLPLDIGTGGPRHERHLLRLLPLFVVLGAAAISAVTLWWGARPRGATALWGGTGLCLLLGVFVPLIGAPLERTTVGAALLAINPALAAGLRHWGWCALSCTVWVLAIRRLLRGAARRFGTELP